MHAVVLRHARPGGRSEAQLVAVELKVGDGRSLEIGWTVRERASHVLVHELSFRRAVSRPTGKLGKTIGAPTKG